jgi:hypothetical protein
VVHGGRRGDREARIGREMRLRIAQPMNGWQASGCRRGAHAPSLFPAPDVWPVFPFIWLQFLVAVCGSGGESSCYSCSESSNTGSELGLDHVFEMQQLRTEATSSTGGVFDTSDTVQVVTTLRSHSDSCASSGFASCGCRARKPLHLVSPGFSPCYYVAERRGLPVPVRLLPTLLQGVTHFHLAFSVGCDSRKPLHANLGLCLSHARNVAKQRLSAVRDKAARTVRGKRRHSSPGLCARWMLFVEIQSPGSFFVATYCIYILSSVVTLPRPVVASIIQLLIGSQTPLSPPDSLRRKVGCMVFFCNASLIRILSKWFPLLILLCRSIFVVHFTDVRPWI